MGWEIVWIFTARLFDHFWWLLGVVFMVEPWLDAHVERYRDWVEQYVSRPVRARVAWTVSFGCLFVASAWAFSDEYWSHQGDLREMYVAQGDAKVQRQRAEDFDRSIHEKGGYLAQIALWEKRAQEAENKPPRVVVQTKTVASKPSPPSGQVAVSAPIPAAPEQSAPQGSQPQMLTNQERERKLVDGLTGIKSELPGIQLWRAKDVGAVNDFSIVYDAFQRIGVTQPDIRMIQRSMSPGEDGLLIEVHDKDHPPPLAVKILKIFAASGIPAQLYSSNIAEGRVMIFGGPYPL